MGTSGSWSVTMDQLFFSPSYSTSKMRKQKPVALKELAVNHMTIYYQNSNSDLPDFKGPFPHAISVAFCLLWVQALFLPELWGLPTAHPSNSSVSIKENYSHLWIQLETHCPGFFWLSCLALLISYLPNIVYQMYEAIDMHSISIQPQALRLREVQ